MLTATSLVNLPGTAGIKPLPPSPISPRLLLPSGLPALPAVALPALASAEPPTAEASLAAPPPAGSHSLSLPPLSVARLSVSPTGNRIEGPHSPGLLSFPAPSSAPSLAPITPQSQQAHQPPQLDADAPIPTEAGSLSLPRIDVPTGQPGAFPSLSPTAGLSPLSLTGSDNQHDSSPLTSVVRQYTPEGEVSAARLAAPYGPQAINTLPQQTKTPSTLHPNSSQSALNGPGQSNTNGPENAPRLPSTLAATNGPLSSRTDLVLDNGAAPKQDNPLSIPKPKQLEPSSSLAASVASYPQLPSLQPALAGSRPPVASVEGGPQAPGAAPTLASEAPLAARPALGLSLPSLASAAPLEALSASLSALPAPKEKKADRLPPPDTDSSPYLSPASGSGPGGVTSVLPDRGQQPRLPATSPVPPRAANPLAGGPAFGPRLPGSLTPPGRDGHPPPFEGVKGELSRMTAALDKLIGLLTKQNGKGESVEGERKQHPAFRMRWSKED